MRLRPVAGKAMPSASAVIIQLARLGDLVQSLPAYVGVLARHPGGRVDILCPAVLAPLAHLFPGVGRVVPWDGGRWRAWSRRCGEHVPTALEEGAQYVAALAPVPYDTAYNLNQHGRAVVLAHLLSRTVIGPGALGVLNETLPPWAAYVREVARTRGANRVHLADAFCGLCGVRPPSAPPRLSVEGIELPDRFAGIGRSRGPWVAVVMGAGDVERTIPAPVWTSWIEQLLDRSPEGQVVLIGAGPETRVAHAVQDGLSSLHQGRVWDATGQWSLPQLAAGLSRCHWVVGADTGPLHLGAAVGVRAMGWYVARARVHETGPYGAGHVVWQAEGGSVDGHAREVRRWPVVESVEWLLDGTAPVAAEGWTVWQSRFDEWGTTYAGATTNQEDARRKVWTSLGWVGPEVHA